MEMKNESITETQLTFMIRINRIIWKETFIEKISARDMDNKERRKYEK
jgi:uncharacterized DUF497 family protein